MPLPNPLFIFVGLLLRPSNMDDPSSDHVPRSIVLSKKTIDDLTKQAKHLGTTGNGTEEYEADEEVSQADKDYDYLVVPGTSKSIPNGRYGKTADGKSINVHHKSTPRKESPGVPSPPTLEIYNPNTGQSEVKIRYPKNGN